MLKRRRNDIIEEVEYEGEGLEVLEGSEREGNKAGEVVADEVEVAEAGEEGERVSMRRFWERLRWRRGVQRDILRGRVWLMELLKRMME